MLTHCRLSVLYRSDDEDEVSKGYIMSQAVVATHGVSIYEDQLAKIHSIIATELWKEIGGDLFGRWNEHGHPLVEYVLGPGYACYRFLTIRLLYTLFPVTDK
jgi:hypothetical protein